MKRPGSLGLLFLGAGRRTSLLRRFIRSCEKESVEPRLVCFEKEMDVPVASLAKVVKCTQWSAWNIDDIIGLARSEDIDVVIPCMDGACYNLSCHATLVEREGRCWPCVSYAGPCVMFGDKREAEYVFNGIGVKTPQFRGRVSFPAIVKPRIGYGGRGQSIAHCESEIRTRTGKYPDKYIVQPLIAGDEYSVDAYVSKTGRVLGCVPRRRLVVHGGEVIKSMTVKDGQIIAEATQIIRACSGFFGPLNLQCIRQKETLYWLEVNCRFGGGVILSIEAGADYTRLLIREALGRPVHPVRWIDGLLMTRSFTETFFDCDNRAALRQGGVPSWHLR